MSHEAAPAAELSVSQLILDADNFMRYGLPSKARQSIEAALRLQPELLEAQERLVDILCVDQALPDAVALLWHMAQTQQQQGDAPLAHKYLEKLLSLAPEHTLAQQAMQQISPPTAVAPLQLPAAHIWGQLDLSADVDDAACREAVAEIRFFVEQGLLQEAEEAWSHLLHTYPQYAQQIAQHAQQP